MIWHKYSVEDRRIPGICALAAVLLVLSLFADSKLTFFLTTLFLFITYANQFYFKKIGQSLLFNNIIQKDCFFINQQGKWVLEFHNEGLPILKGEIKVYFDQVVSPFEEQVESMLFMHEISVPFSIFTHQKKRITIPFKTKMRGNAKIRKLEMHIPNIIGFGEIVLEYKNIVHQDIFVYPVPIPVKYLKERLSMRPEWNVAPLSIYEDRLAPQGTRDYVFSDSFNRIHWKASARKQSLQTKIYEQITDNGWNIAINISDGYAITGQLEQLLSSVTEFAYYAYKRQIPYSFCINIRSAGNIPFLFIPLGQGNKHLQKVLEILASINTLHVSFPYEKMLSYYNRHLATQPFFIHGGIRTSSVDALFLEMVRKKVLLLELKVNNESGWIIPLDVQRESGVSQ
ncbi:DUF58 domain-containing protein [Neobacillus sp. PS3-40]|uniref:DUF58 domain-containing protein n=1 Tax=Neobacillus sp. PS3-40 TaxID=3070679 RepID=UPI0027DF0112|nr:DUF58 domain-containing protein [Neobacillus sp. PS3-40]WML43514.1 DUF58 domain-containing protein [Neobacillus sp. PS3-40]